MAQIRQVYAREILDSRSHPTVEAKIILDDGFYGVSSAPSGASIAKSEGIEVRDADPQRFAGLGVRKAVANVVEIIGPKLIGTDCNNQAKIDQILLELDRTENKQKLGVNAILPVSAAAAAAAASSQRLPLYRYLNKLAQTIPKIPIPMFNIINGGKHGDGNLDFQEFMIVPASSYNFATSLQMGVEIYDALKKVLIARKEVVSVGDEGGFAPSFYTNAEALEVLSESVGATVYRAGRELFFALDVAATQFQKDSGYLIRDRASPLSSAEFIDYYKDLLTRFHLLILEDPLGEEDWEGWKSLTGQVGNQLIIVGDDLLATNVKRLGRAIKEKAANGILIKPNQAGTVTETLTVIKTAAAAGWKIIVSHRSGETIDTFVADLAVAVGADYVKFGAPARGERVAKYNRLLEIANSFKRAQVTGESADISQPAVQPTQPTQPAATDKNEENW